MRYATLIILLMLSFAACSKKTTTTSTTITDSTVVKEVVRLDTVHIAGDTVRIKEFIECDSITNKPKPFRIRERSGRAAATVEVKADGSLHVEALCDSLQKVIEVMDKEIFRLRKEKKVVTITETPSKFKVWIDYTCRALAVVFLLFIAFMVLKNRFI